MSMSIVHFFVIGMTWVRSASLGALSDTASLGRTGSAPKSAMRGTIPEVETVMRDSGMPTSSTSNRTACMKLS